MLENSFLTPLLVILIGLAFRIGWQLGGIVWLLIVRIYVELKRLAYAAAGR